MIFSLMAKSGLRIKFLSYHSYLRSTQTGLRRYICCSSAEGDEMNGAELEAITSSCRQK